jgi:hypothetical protein
MKACKGSIVMVYLRVVALMVGSGELCVRQRQRESKRQEVKVKVKVKFIL